MGVAATRSVEQIEIVIGQIEATTTEFQGEVSTTFSVIGVGVFVDPFRVVKDGKQPNDFDLGSRRFAQSQAVLQNSGPMYDAVNAVDGQSILRQDRLNDWAEVGVGGGLCHFFFTGFTGNF